MHAEDVLRRVWLPYGLSWGWMQASHRFTRDLLPVRMHQPAGRLTGGPPAHGHRLTALLSRFALYGWQAALFVLVTGTGDMQLQMRELLVEFSMGFWSSG